MWLPAGWGGVIGLGVSGCAGWALAYIGDAAIRDWATGLLAAVAGVSGLVIWIRSLDLDLADRQWRRRRVRDDDDGAAADDDMSALRDSLKRLPQPRPVAIPDNRPAPATPALQLSPSAAARPTATKALPDRRAKNGRPAAREGG